MVVDISNVGNMKDIRSIKYRYAIDTINIIDTFVYLYKSLLQRNKHTYISRTLFIIPNALTVPSLLA